MNNIIIKSYLLENGEIIAVNFRKDGYFYATEVAKQFSLVQNKSRQVVKFLANQDTQEYIKNLIDLMNSQVIDFNQNSKSNFDKNQQVTYDMLVISKKGGNDAGTWLHPKLAIVFARWLDARFAIWCDLQIEEILKNQSENLSHKITDEHYKISLEIAKTTSELLRLSDTSNLKMMEKICEIYKVDASFLPVYVEQQPVTNLTQLLKEFNLHHFSAKKLNPILEQLGILEKISRRSTRSKSGTTTYWSLTSKGLEFGKNEASPQSPRETQPLYFRDKFRQLIDLFKKL